MSESLSLDVIGIVCGNPDHPKGRRPEVGMFGCHPTGSVWTTWPFVRGVTLQAVDSEGHVWDWPKENPPNDVDHYMRLRLACPLCSLRYVRRWPIPQGDPFHEFLNNTRRAGENIATLRDLVATLS